MRKFIHAVAYLAVSDPSAVFEVCVPSAKNISIFTTKAKCIKMFT